MIYLTENAYNNIEDKTLTVLRADTSATILKIKKEGRKAAKKGAQSLLEWATGAIATKEGRK